MTEQWISASQALDLAGSDLAICGRLKAGLVLARARLLLIDDDPHSHAIIPIKFWWAEGREALEQDWEAGDFSTWIDHSQRWQAFGVTFALSGILELLPVERRGIAARSLSVSGNSDWIPAFAARRFAYEVAGLNPASAGDAIIAKAKLGFITARAVVGEGKPGETIGVQQSWEVREWDVPPWFWENFTLSGHSSQNWERGDFSGRGVAPNGLRQMALSAVHFLRVSLDALLPAGMSPPKVESRIRNSGGRPPAPFNDNLMCAIWALIYQGDFKPKRQKDIENAIKDWVIANGHDIGDTPARDKARKIWAALNAEVENPTG